MCWKWRKKAWKKNNTPLKPITPESNYSSYSNNREELLNSYYSPNCTKRPFYASKICQNCSSVFYNYLDTPYCSKECKISRMLSGYNSN